MKKTLRIFLSTIVLMALMLPFNGCKSDKSFDITGVWEFVEQRDDEASAGGNTVILEGSPTEGSVERHPVKDDYWRGSYRVEQNQVFIQIGYCRGAACMVINYRGSVIYEKLVTGTLEGSASIAGDVYHTWTGTWQLRRE